MNLPHAPAAQAAPAGKADIPRPAKQLNPALILLSIVFMALAFTYFVDSGRFRAKTSLLSPVRTRPWKRTPL